MPTDADIIALVNCAFGKLEKPEHFTDFGHCDECHEHDELLRTKNRDTLRIGDVGNICWQPISICSPQGVGYYLPALARLALDSPTNEYGWYGDTLYIHFTSNGSDASFYKFCSAEQRLAVAALLHHLNTTRSTLKDRITTLEQFDSARRLWLGVP